MLLKCIVGERLLEREVFVWEIDDTVYTVSSSDIYRDIKFKYSNLIFESKYFVCTFHASAQGGKRMLSSLDLVIIIDDNPCRKT